MHAGHLPLELILVFIASQMGHTNAQMVFNVYGAWMKDNNHEQIELLNKRLSESVPCMPHKKVG